MSTDSIKWSYRTQLTPILCEFSVFVNTNALRRNITFLRGWPVTHCWTLTQVHVSSLFDPGSDNLSPNLKNQLDWQNGPTSDSESFISRCRLYFPHAAKLFRKKFQHSHCSSARRLCRTILTGIITSARAIYLAQGAWASEEFFPGGE